MEDTLTLIEFEATTIDVTWSRWFGEGVDTMNANAS